MKFPHIGVMALVILLAGCYGTKVPPPVSSFSAPPGLGPPITAPHFLPADLPGLLVVYRRELIRDKHDLPHAKAAQFADEEIARLSQQYSGRDSELKAEIIRRLEPVPTQSATPAAPTSTTGYPRDQTSK